MLESVIESASADFCSPSPLSQEMKTAAVPANNNETSERVMKIILVIPPASARAVPRALPSITRVRAQKTSFRYLDTLAVSLRYGVMGRCMVKPAGQGWQHSC